MFSPQIALGIGVLTSNRRGGWVHTLADWTWCRCWVPLLAAIAGWHVVGFHFDRLDVMPLLGAMVRCHCWMPWWVPLLGTIAGVPLLDAIAGCEKKLTRVLHRSPLHFSLH